MGNQAQDIFIDAQHDDVERFAKAGGTASDRVEYPGDVGRGTANYAENVAGAGLLLARLGQLAFELLNLSAKVVRCIDSRHVSATNPLNAQRKLPMRGKVSIALPSRASGTKPILSHAGCAHHPASVTVSGFGRLPRCGVDDLMSQAGTQRHSARNRRLGPLLGWSGSTPAVLAGVIVRQP